LHHLAGERFIGYTFAAYPEYHEWLASLFVPLAPPPIGQRIVTASADNTTKVWEAASGRELLTLKGHSSAIRSVAFSPDGQRIVTGSGDNTATVWEAATPAQVARWQAEEQAAGERMGAERRRPSR